MNAKEPFKAYRIKANSEAVIYRQLGERIVAARRKRGMSQEQLASHSGVDRSHVGFIEQGRRRPTIATLHKITTSLGISLEQLFKGL